MSFDLPKILPPYDDMVFKSILTRPDAEPARVDLLTALLGRTVTSATVRNAELPGRDIDVKQERFDMSCSFDDGDQAAVEMQAEPMRGDSSANRHKNIRERAAFGLCDLHANQTGSGVDYADFVKSYHITITNYRVLNEDRQLVETFNLSNDRGVVLTESIAAVFVDLTLVGRVLKKPVDEMTAAEMWAVFLAKADEPKCGKIVEKIMKLREGISVANTMLRTISQDEYERARFHSRKMALQDAEHNRVTALKEGRAEVLDAFEMFGADPELMSKVTEYIKNKKR
ncbi:MAG: Rpn family recombination-promoting nuclease/putative transposase [Oscillospiraceae bacterium]|jgi:predicted transposase/invertase (TIGR01784 family)|nr:Rpn family recombination-promoting nuclease/putative transposase [Oscillospiraceae bacterium]